MVMGYSSVHDEQVSRVMMMMMQAIKAFAHPGRFLRCN